MDGQIPRDIRRFVEKNLTKDETQKIGDQFSESWLSNRQVLWTGMQREAAQKWADGNGMQTLTTAMGPLMNESHCLCPKKTKTTKQWTEYIHGASAIFALHISNGDVVTVLTPPPPARFHPSGFTSFQIIEEPIIKGKLRNHAVRRIDIVHPSIAGASRMRYQLWPKDEYSAWVSIFGHPKIVTKWRPISTERQVLGLDAACCPEVLSDNGLASTETAQEVRQSPESSMKKLLEKQSKQIQEVLEQESQMRKTLQNVKAKEIQSLQQKYAEERIVLKRKTKNKEEKLKVLQKAEARDMHAVHKSMKDQKRNLAKEEATKMDLWKEKHKRQTAELQAQQSKEAKKAAQSETAQIKTERKKAEQRKTNKPKSTQTFVKAQDMATKKPQEHVPENTTSQKSTNRSSLEAPFASHVFFLFGFVFD